MMLQQKTLPPLRTTLLLLRKLLQRRLLQRKLLQRRLPLKKDLTRVMTTNHKSPNNLRSLKSQLVLPQPMPSQKKSQPEKVLLPPPSVPWAPTPVLD